MKNSDYTSEEVQVLMEFFTKELRKKDDNIYRHRFIIVALCIVIAMLLIK
jgi:hypothetical protein